MSRAGFRGDLRQPQPASLRWSPAAAAIGVVLAAIVASGCGGSSSGSASRSAVPPPVARASPTTVATTAPTDAATTYDTHLERDLARSFEYAFFTGTRPATLSQVPPRTDLFVREPATVCAHVHRAAYRCSVTYEVRTRQRSQRVEYELRRRRGCFTAIAAAIAATRTLHRLSNC